jgi:phosphate:Na+ symporter
MIKSKYVNITIKTLLFLIFAYLILINPNAKVVVAGVAIFMIGIYFMEEGFKLFSGGVLEDILQNFTRTTPKAIITGFFTTALVQSSSLISLIVISFLSAELINLTQAIGVIFGANIGTSSTAWIIATVGLKINIAAYAMPLIIFGVIFRFSKNDTYIGIGNIFLGIGFIFLGIEYMKNGFEELKSSIDLAQYAMKGYGGILIYILIGLVATVIMQSSSATIAIIITALASGQIIYINALALAIGSNLGTTITAILGSIGSNDSGKKLAIAHFIFNFVTAVVAAIFIYQISSLVDFLSTYLNISDHDFTMKLALFHTIFNIAGVLILSGFITTLVKFLNKLFLHREKPIAKYLDESVLEVPISALEAMHKEVINLYDQSLKTIIHSLNLSRDEIRNQDDMKKVVKHSHKKLHVDIDKEYRENLQKLYEHIIRYASLAQKNMDETEIQQVYKLKISARRLIESVRQMKELQKNINHYERSKNLYIKKEYINIKEKIAFLFKNVEMLKNPEKGQTSRFKIIKHLVLIIQDFKVIKNGKIDQLLDDDKITAYMATSLTLDSKLAYSISKNIIQVSSSLFNTNPS